MTAPGPTLVIGPAWVGDMVMAQALLIRLKQDAPERALDVVAPAWSRGLLARMPEVRAAIALDIGHGELGWGKRLRLGRQLRAQGYEQAIILPRSLKAALVPYFARIPQRTGYRGEFRYGLVNDRRPFEPERLDQTVKRFVALGADSGSGLPAELPLPRLRTDRELAQQLLQRLVPGSPGSIAALMPGAEYGPAKQWPVQHFVALAHGLVARGMDVVLLGSQKDAAGAEQIARGSGSDRVFNLCGRTTLEEVVDVLSLATVAISNDSGLMHIAAAAGVPIVGIYGSSSGLFTPPLSPRGRVASLALDCSPCFRRQCPLGHLRCLVDLRPAQVEALVDELLQAS